MRRTVLQFSLLIAAAVAIVAILHWRSLRQHAEQLRRDARYQEILATYQRDLPEGLRRDKVEEYLRSKNIALSEAGCDEAPCDIIRVGSDQDTPWYCGPATVYVIIDFDSSDKVATIFLEKRLENCP